MIERRFELTEWGSICSDNDKESLKCYDECKEAAYELGSMFSGEMNQHWATVNPKTGCYFWGSEIFLWSRNETGKASTSHREVCRRKGKCCIICFITHVIIEISLKITWIVVTYSTF